MDALNDKKLIVSASPHIRSQETISSIMWTVVAALAPAAIFSIWHFGALAAATYFFCIAGSVGCECLIQKFRKIEITIDDGSAFLTGLLLAMCLPPGLPWFMCVFGSAMAIGVAKHTMGGLGQNVFNPAHIGRAALLASWPVAMTTWTAMPSALDGVTSATPLSILKQQGFTQLVATFGDVNSLLQAMLLGMRNGSTGETSTILLLLGGLFLIYRGIINWQIPASMIGTVGIFAFFISGQGIAGALFHMMAGGLVIGAFFMATDMVTIPITVKGQIIFGVGAGLLVMLIRTVGGYPEGVCYSILLMNAVTPVIDRFVQPKRFGLGGEHV